MSLKNIIKKISEHREIVQYPPILIDIGASAEINKHWKQISYFSVCIAFDADDRDFQYSEEENSQYKKLIKVNKIVVPELKAQREDFYLTKSPYCSSLLEPDLGSLSKFHYSHLFQVKEKSSIEAVALPKVLDDLSIGYIDWFKTDSQGIDLRLFKSIGEKLQDKVIVLEIEPGFINAYKGEDKIIDFLNFMEAKKEFFLTDFTIKGPLRIPQELFEPIFTNSFHKKIATNFYKHVPGWAEITFMNDFTKPGSVYGSREHLLGWLFSTLQEHHEIAYVYAYKAHAQFPQEEIFVQLKKYSERKLKKGVYDLAVISRLFKHAFKRFFS